MSPAEQLLTVWHRTMSAAPDAPAVIDAATDRITTRVELEASATEARAALPPRLANRRVLLIEPNSPRWFARFLALLQAGAVPVPVDPTETPARQDELARGIRAAGIWTPDGYRAVPGVRPVHDAEAVLIKLTSGSTGRPQPLRFTTAQMLADGRQVCRSMGIRSGDTNLAIIPFGHSYGLGNLVLPLLDQGTTLVVPPAAMPRILGETCARWQCTVFPAVPTLLRLLVAAEVDPKALATLRLVITAGAVLPPSVAQAFVERYQRRVHNFYGSSETGGISFDRDGEATLTGRSVGRPLEGVTIAPSPGGRFWVESAAVLTLGRRRGLVPATLELPGRHRPGDRGELNAEGELVLGGRAGRIVKVGGRRVELGEIEAALRRVPEVTDAYAAPHPAVAEELAAVVQTKLSERQLRTVLATQWPPWKIPRRLVCQPVLPVTSRGKLDTQAAQRLLDDRRPAPA
jgi:long-chain acyl-CoA synthetase